LWLLPYMAALSLHHTMMRKRSEIRKTFKEHGLAPKKWMGQNLLADQSYLARIVSAAAPKPGEAIVEVGAGLGALTEALVASGAKVWALEVDAGFHRVLEDKFGDSSQVELLHEDALSYDFRALAARIGKLRVVANLPYSISSRLLFSFFENRDIFSSLHILLQKEVAERLVADPSTKEYGVLTVLLSTSAVVDMLFDIPGSAFFPVPEVVSTLVKVTFPDTPPVPVSDTRLLTLLVKASFAGRRKTLRNNLRNVPIVGVTAETIASAAADAGIDLQRRGETLSCQEFCCFADAVARIRDAG
jgi:16S rRNA (adenine1518-N6/adenine1519-N6)-dimethyltransferase